MFEVCFRQSRSRPGPYTRFDLARVFALFSISYGLCGNAAWPDVLAAYARAASDPLKRPAIAAPVITALDRLIIYQLSFYGFFPLLHGGARRDPSLGSCQPVVH
jgi:hypothetical protein